MPKFLLRGLKFDKWKTNLNGTVFLIESISGQERKLPVIRMLISKPVKHLSMNVTTSTDCQPIPSFFGLPKLLRDAMA